MYVIIESKTGNYILIKSQDKLVITKGYGVRATTIEGLLQCCALRKSVTDGRNTRDQITSDIEGSFARDENAFCAFRTFLVEVQTNTGYHIHATHA